MEIPDFLYIAPPRYVRETRGVSKRMVSEITLLFQFSMNEPYLCSL
jgi:hypothetical protein